MADIEEDESFATVEDLKLRWPACPAGQYDRILEFLRDATQLIKDSCSDWGDASQRTLRQVTCKIVKRLLKPEADGDDDQGPCGGATNCHTYSNPYGDLYITSSEIAQVEGNGQTGAWEADLLAR